MYCVSMEHEQLYVCELASALENFKHDPDVWFIFNLQ